MAKSDEIKKVAEECLQKGRTGYVVFINTPGSCGYILIENLFMPMYSVVLI